MIQRAARMGRRFAGGHFYKSPMPMEATSFANPPKYCSERAAKLIKACEPAKPKLPSTRPKFSAEQIVSVDSKLPSVWKGSGRYSLKRTGEDYFKVRKLVAVVLCVVLLYGVCCWKQKSNQSVLVERTRRSMKNDEMTCKSDTDWYRFLFTTSRNNDLASVCAKLGITVGVACMFWEIIFNYMVMVPLTPTAFDAI
ncbi:MAG: hypothetical protein MHM6MM_002847 [Cercozoa sp. M6MM]